MNKKGFFLAVCFIFIFSLTFVSAGITINPSKITVGDTAKITIDLPEYNPYVYFYKDKEVWNKRMGLMLKRRLL